MFLRYLVAVALTMVATALTYLFAPYLSHSVFLVWTSAIGLTALLVGLGPAFLAIGLSLFITIVLRFPPLVAPNSGMDVIRFVVWGAIMVALAWGISRSQKVARRRKEIEDVYAAIMMRESDAIIITDLTGIITEINAGALHMLGYERPGMIGANLADLMYPKERHISVWLNGEGAGGSQITRRLLRGDGGIIPVEGHGSHIAGNRILVIVRDISERERTAAALEASERRLRLIAANTSDVIYAYDMEHRLLYVNPAFEQLTGYPVTWLENTPDLDIIYPEDRARAVSLLHGLFEGRGFQDEEIRIITRSGGVKWILSTWGPIYDEAGLQIGVQGRDHDNTTRKRVEQALRESEERLQLAQRSADAGVWEWDINTSQVFWSDVYYELFGLDARSVPASYQAWVESVAPEERAATEQAVRAALENRTDLAIAFRIDHPEKGERWIASLGRTVCDADGIPIRMAGIAIDITAQKKIEEALRDSEERLRLALLAGNVGVWDWDIEKSSIAWSEHVYKFHGIALGEFDGKLESFVRIIHPDDLNRVTSSIQRSVTEQVPYDIEFRVVWRTGEIRWLTTTGMVIYAADGHPVRMLGATADITERKVAENALRESRERLDAALAAAGTGTYRWDLRTGIIDRDVNLDRLFGITRTGPRERFDDFGMPLHPDDYERVRAAVQEHIVTGKVYTIEYRIVMADGSIHWVADVGHPTKDENGKVLYITGACVDITAWKNAEEERSRLLEAERSARELAEGARSRAAFLAEASAILASSLDHDTTLASLARLAVPSLADFCLIFEIVGEHQVLRRAFAHADHAKEPEITRLFDLLPIDTANPDSMVAGILRSRKPALIDEYPADVVERLRDVPEQWELYQLLHPKSFLLVPIESHGHLTGVLLLGTSESDRHFTREDLDLGEDLARRAAMAIENARLYREAREANAAKDKFLAILSHELRTPLTPSLGAVHALRDERLPDEFRPLVEIIGRNIELEARLIDDLLDLTRITKGKLSLETGIVSVHTLLRNVIEICREDLAAKHQVLLVELTAVEDRVDGDAARLQQIFWNLIKNAVKFTPPTGTITIRTADYDERIGIEVADTGVGIEPQMLRVIFDAFVQGPRGKGHQGLGLGLSITKSLVEMHDGTITAASAGPGEGASFQVLLPRIASGRHEPQGEPPAASPAAIPG